jgi:hypothetical protein
MSSIDDSGIVVSRKWVDQKGTTLKRSELRENNSANPRDISETV